MKRIMLIMAIACCMLGLGNSAAYANYTWVISTDTIGYYVDYDSKTYFNGHLFYWVKLKYEDEETRQAEIKYNMAGRRNAVDYSNFYYTQQRMETYYCNDGACMCKINEIIDFDYNGKIINWDNYGRESNKFYIYTPDSIGKYIDDCVRAYTK